MRVNVSPITQSMLLALAVATTLSVPRAHAELETCLQALGRLTYAPYNASLPFLNGVSGRVNIGYLYQKPMFAVMPNEAMGSFDLCRHADLYTTGAVKTKYCALSHDKAGICVPQECSEADLHNKELMQPLMNLGVQAALEVPMNCIIDPYLSKECAFSRQGWDYYQGLYNVLATLGQDTPRSKGSVSCELKAMKPDDVSFAMMGLTGLFSALAVVGATWLYLYAAARRAKKQREANAAAVQPLPSPGYKPVALTVKSPPTKEGEFRDISLEESKQTQTPRSATTAGTNQQQQSSASNTGAAAPVTQDINAYDALAELLRIPDCPKAVAAFSFVDNWNEIFTLKARGGEFAIFDGMKAISAAWVVFYHVLLWQIYFVQNPEYLIPPKGLLSKTWATPFFNYSGTLSVDTFFFISGFLASYFLLIKLDKEDARGIAKPAWKWVPTLYMHRWMRITPAYAFSFFLHWKIAPLLAYGPLAKTVWENNSRPCKNTWWAHMLYINDLYPWWNQRLGDVCYGHSWYLANDMQYFLLVPLLAILYRRSAGGRRAAKYFTFACLLSCIITSWVLSIKDHWSPISWDGVEGDHYREQGFSRPWTRCSSYMIGILASYAWYEKRINNPEGKFLPFQANFIWAFGLFLLAISMYGPHSASGNIIPCNLPVYGQKCGSGWSATTKAAVIALLRPTWTLGLACISVLCWNNQGGFIQHFLASPYWFPLSTLSFCIYLVHYTVLTYYISQRTLRIRFELFGFLNTFFGLMAISCGLALMVVLLVEKPFMKLQKLWFEGGAAAEKKKALAKGGVESAAVNKKLTIGSSPEKSMELANKSSRK